MEKIVADRVLLRERAFRQIRRVHVGKDEPRVVAPSHKLRQIVFLCLEHAVIDLQLLGIKSVNDVSGLHVCTDVVSEIERGQRPLRF